MTHKQHWESRTHSVSLDNDPVLLPLPSMAPTPHGAPGHSQDEVTPMGAGMDTARSRGTAGLEAPAVITAELV